MRLRNKMALCMALVCGIFMVALAVALMGMQAATARFDSFIESDQAFVVESNNIYAQGLQMGQALRNIIVEPANPKAYQNLAAARDAFRKGLAHAQELAAAEPAVLQTLRKIGSVHEKQAQLQDEIVALAKQDQAAAIAALTGKETPTWRVMRDDILKLIKAKGEAVQVTKAELEASTSKRLVSSLVMAAIAAVAGAGVCFWMTRSLMRQLGGEPDYAAAIAKQIAAGDLTAAIEVDSESNRTSLIYAMRSMQQSLAALVAKVRSGTDAITTASGEIATGNLDLSARTEEQASSLQETAASMEELTSTVHQNSENVRQANELASAASAVAAKGGAVVAEVVGTMGSINESSRKIVDIIGVIDGIAFQTNILALNAAVEAARAGEQGRGFAVVAGEVRNLAQRSAAAAKEIKELIGNSVDKVDAGSALVDSAGATMQEVVASVRRVTEIMAEIALAGQEQSAGIGQVNQAIAQMDQVTQQNAALVEEAAAAADSMQEQARQLSTVVSTFKLASEQQHSGAARAAVRGARAQMHGAHTLALG